MCNGFYAQNHGEVVCSVCHAFLFPHFAPDLPLKSLDVNIGFVFTFYCVNKM